MRIIVTGVAGFIGSHCAQALIRAGHRVHGIDNLNDYYISSLKRYRLEQLKLAGDYAFSQIDICDQDAMTEVFRNFQPEAVLHLAAQAGVRYSLTHPFVYGDTNFTGTLNILECCRHFGKPRLVYASSSSVYGGNTKLPFSEDDRVDTPVSLYAATKKANELTAHTYTHLYDLQTIGMRFFTVYGPMGRPDMAMWLFTDAISHGRPIKVFNHGDMSRDFTYIDDIVSGVTASLTVDGLDRYEIFNLGNNGSERLMYLIEQIEQCLGREAEKIMMPMQDGDVKDTYADISRASAKLGFKPSTRLSEGVPRFVEWYRAHPHFHGPDTVTKT
ncbi:MAG: GDP-mannose 4,6-dehydratase [Acidobacteriota bacterium]|nr:GDP-mannose 4,6-dehydratase [Acidobacteriota bacterium]